MLVVLVGSQGPKLNFLFPAVARRKENGPKGHYTDYWKVVLLLVLDKRLCQSEF